MHKLKVLIAYCFWLCMPFYTWSQAVVTPTSGCAPLAINCTAPAGAASWNFGSGPPVTFPNTSYVYNTPGTFVVTYSGVAGNMSQTIIVYANNLSAGINYTVSPSGCYPRVVNFVGTGGSPNSNYTWVFDDGQTAAGSNLTYTYTIAGIFYPSFTILDPVTSCTSNATAGPINVSAPATLDITANPGFGACQAPFTTAFTASTSVTGSPLGGGLTYQWNFGNSQTSNQATPPQPITYNQGIFAVTLVATDNNNCITTKTVQVSVVQPTLSVTAPTIQCVRFQYGNPGQELISVQSSESVVLVQLDDGTPPFNVNTPNPNAATSFTHISYTVPGVHTRTFTVANGTCVTVVVHTTTVEEIVPSFTTALPNYTCSPTMIKNYLNQTTVNTSSSLSYTWTVEGWDGFADAINGSTLTSPQFTFHYGSLNPYTQYLNYAPIVSMIVESSIGCTTLTALVIDSLHRPTAWFNKSVQQGCAPLQVQFMDSTETNSVIYPVQSYTWNNGANPATIVTGVSPPPNVNPTFTYNAPGTYTPYLIIMTVGGCIDTSYVDTVIVVNPPTASIVFTPGLNVCAGEPVTINLQSTPATSLVTHWHVESDNGFFSGCVNDPAPTWAFTHPGVHSFLLSAYQNECGSTQVSTQTITVRGPVGKFRYRTYCATKLSVDFFTRLIDAQSATIDFGDGTPVIPLAGNLGGSESYTTNHVFSGSGDFTVSLTSVNGSCVFNYSTVVTVRQISANFTMTPVICNNRPQLLEASSSNDVLEGCSRGYAWFIDNEPPIQTSSSTFLTDTFRIVGDHNIHLWVKDINGCTDTITKVLRVSGPAVDFAFNQTPLCLTNNPAIITNLTPQTPDAVLDFTVDLGLGGPLQTYILSQFPISNVYPAAVPSSTYSIKMKATNVIGCIDSTVKILKVNNPTTFLTPSSKSICVNQPITIYVTPGYTNEINFNVLGGAPTTTDISGPTTYTCSYPAPGVYSVSLIARDADGCGTVAQGFTVSVQAYPVADFVFSVLGQSISPNPVFCFNNISFTSTTLPAPSASFNYTYTWNLDGSTELNIPVVVDDFGPGVHTVTLTATTSHGCGSTMTHSFAISNPTAVPHVDKPRFCFGETVKVSISDSAQVGSWQWIFIGGPTQPLITASSVPSPSLSHTYDYYLAPSGSGVINLIYYGTGQYCSHLETIPVQMIKIDPDFNRNLELSQNDYEHCLNIQDDFTNRTKLNNSGFLGGLSFSWGLGDGATSTDQSTNHTYAQPGVYSVTLSVSDFQSGCSQKTVKNMTINPLPTVTVSATDSVCKNSVFALNSSGSPEITEYTWVPAAGLTSPNSASTAATSSVSSSYSLQVVNRYGCKGASANTASVYVQQPPINTDWDTTVIVGQSISLNSNQGSGFSYTWSPLTNLSCSTCPYPVSSSTVNITYTVEVKDPMGCFRVLSVYTVNVDPLTTVDVPTAFTPNGDGVNDVIYVDGWGIKKLNYFRIFNRWGQLLFESFDIKNGWDGTYLGVPQNMETYVYQASVETYTEGKNLEKTSTFRLIR